MCIRDRAKAVKSAKGEVQEAIIQADFLDSNNSPFELTPEDKSHIFVFDEEYVDKNIKIQESCLLYTSGHQDGQAHHYGAGPQQDRGAEKSHPCRV